MVRHFLDIADYTSEELTALLDLAQRLKQEWRSGGNRPVLKGKTLAMLFMKPSLRTRVSFDMAMRHVGGDALYLSPAEVGLGKRESVADVSRVLSHYVDGIMARVFEHAQILALAKYASIPVINGLSDFSHPCQGLTDALTIREHFGSFAGLKLAYIGDGNNVAVSLLQICSRLGMDFAIASPEGYELPKAVVFAERPMAEKAGSEISLERSPAAAVAGADVVYTDAWTSMGQEEEAKLREQAFAGYQINAQLLRQAKPGAVVLHCLPAHRGQEITDDVADGPQSLIFPQAENRLHAQKAVLVDLLSPLG